MHFNQKAGVFVRPEEELMLLYESFALYESLPRQTLSSNSSERSAH